MYVVHDVVDDYPDLASFAIGDLEERHVVVYRRGFQPEGMSVCVCAAVCGFVCLYVYTCVCVCVSKCVFVSVRETLKFELILTSRLRKIEKLLQTLIL